MRDHGDVARVAHRLGKLRAAIVRTVHFVVPDSIDDPTRPSGGNVYDRKVIHALRQRGWHVDEHAVGGQWPDPDESAHRALADTLDIAAANTIVRGILQLPVQQG